jgi:hypothetical protein
MDQKSIRGADLLNFLEKIKKSIFSIDNANISQLYLLDKLVSGRQGEIHSRSTILLLGHWGYERLTHLIFSERVNKS